ncbi:hypothetical protein DY000_02008461 [Brassica cretica]|uniref:Uncharacterized protein n=1 Tax=Brassica cretica TaxID=69181 RepID=A0ABQ7C9R1_BRACR|nr:hypothetical protein DY000_02008461 [Brassica cretica]
MRCSAVKSRVRRTGCHKNLATSIRTSIIKLPGSEGSRSDAADTYCESWRLAVETNNAGTWDVLPSSCVDSIGDGGPTIYF